MINPITSRRDLVGRILFGLLSVSTLVAFVDGIGLASGAGPDTFYMQWWRTLAYLVFAAIFALLALRPRSTPLMWEIVLIQKATITIIGYLNITVAEAPRDATVDLYLVLVMVPAWILCRGWLSWKKESAPIDATDRSVVG
ncbi:hypothetical protein [Glaciihabitans sp. UYNi722]|uniref:hypothetical protein n=1 Tax=Glaciihabitans sp. UYNi722 TaxID=3156344 RepID=UPI003392BA84